MRYFQPLHLDSGNRGCEAITKGTALLLQCEPKNLLSLSCDVAIDERFGYSNYCTLIPVRKASLTRRLVNRFVCHFLSDKWKRQCVYYKDRYAWFLKQMGRDDILLSTGGDMLCYADNEVIFTNNYAFKHGIKTILWGCSFGEENITPKKTDTLKRFSLIYARESLSEQVFRSLGFNNVLCLPDPAFILEPESCELPACFKQSEEIIGFNLSNFTLKNDDFNTLFGREIIALFDMILKSSHKQILLIPHVFWTNQDDRISCTSLYDRYKETGRVSLLNTSDYNYCQIRYIISHCQFFFGARTHSVISAYATCTPAVALGYSIKSKGIAKDLMLSERTLVDTKNFKKGALLDAYQYVVENENDIREHLHRVMPEYKQRTYKIREYLH